MQTKLKICSICLVPSILWKASPKLCKGCAGKIASKAAAEKSKGAYKQSNLTQTESGKVAKPFKYQTSITKRVKSLTVDEIIKKAGINEFFKLQALQVPERCENCNLLLRAHSDTAKRFVTAHILPKNDREFPTVATHPMNRMFLGFGLFSDCNCHDLWDKRDAEARKLMACYPVALERAQTFYDNLSPHDQVRADKYLGIELIQAI